MQFLFRIVFCSEYLHRIEGCGIVFERRIVAECIASERKGRIAYGIGASSTT